MLITLVIPEKVIQDRTGHMSLDGLRKYERISEEQKQPACKVLAVKPDSLADRAMKHANYELSCILSATTAFGSAAFHECTYHFNIFQAPQNTYQRCVGGLKYSVWAMGNVCTLSGLKFDWFV